MMEGEGGTQEFIKPKKQFHGNGKINVDSLDVLAISRRIRARHGLPPTPPPTVSQPRQGK